MVGRRASPCTRAHGTGAQDDSVDALLELAYHCEVLHRELMCTGYVYLSPDDYAQRLRSLRESARERRERRGAGK